VLTVIVVLGWNTSGDKGQPTTKPGALGIGSPSPTAAGTAPSTAKPSPSATPAASNVIKITAVGGDCWMQVRRDNSTGIVLFTGTVKQGEKRAFKGKRLWVSFGNPAAVRLEAYGKKVKLKSAVGPWPVAINSGLVFQGPQTQG
jgi:hypothetical protein